jgi:hypothetical protein
LFFIKHKLKGQKHPVRQQKGKLNMTLYEQATEENKLLRGLLLWTLYHNQGGSSEVGQPIRRALCIGQHDRLTAAQINEGSRDATMMLNAKVNRAP